MEDVVDERAIGAKRGRPLEPTCNGERACSTQAEDGLRAGPTAAAKGAPGQAVARIGLLQAICALLQRSRHDRQQGQGEDQEEAEGGGGAWQGDRV